MRLNGNRTLKIKKADLIIRIMQNKENHIDNYKKAVKAYKKQALKQLNDLLLEAANDRLNIRLNLTSPIDNSERYDDLIEMFEWEQDKILELSQDEFRDYVQDDTNFTREAMLTNSMYMSTT